MASNTVGTTTPAQVCTVNHADRTQGDLPPPTFDLELWAGNYTGSLLPVRLAHVAFRCPSLARPSLALAIDAAKKGRDVHMYTRLCEMANALGLTDLANVDQEWASRQDEGNRRELARLESELRGYKNNLIRESIRMGQEDLAYHLLLTGGPLPDPANPGSLSSSGYGAAYQAFGRIRDYCTTPSHVNGMTLRLIYTAILQAVTAMQFGLVHATHWSSVKVNAGRLRASGVKDEEQNKLTPISYVAAGLAHLSLGEYKDAATTFLQAPFYYNQIATVHNTDFPRDVASANDVAIHGGLCALATFTRDALINEVLGGPFRQFLELEPQMRKAITLYTTAKYRACIDLLRQYYSDWSLDLFLGSGDNSEAGSHVDNLFARIRERSIAAYFSAFSQVSLAALAQTFPPVSDAPDAMEVEIIRMIESGVLDARIDVVDGIVLAQQKDVRQAAHAEARKTADEIERTLLLRLHKINMVMAGLEIPRSKPEGEFGIQAGKLRNGAF